MAGFHTHITVSSAVGAGYAWWVHTQFGLPWSTSAVAGGLCSIAGILPDLDSDSGIPARETIGFTAAVVPLLLMHRFQKYGLTLEQMLLAGVPVYIFIRFGLGTLLKEFTIHRGMFHSIPAMLLSGMTTFLISDSGGLQTRALKGIAVSLGYLSHLVLDEIWSVEVNLTGSRLKSSSGTALKFFSKNAAANAMCWGLMILAAFAVYEENGLADLQAEATPTSTIVPAPIPSPRPTITQQPVPTFTPIDDPFPGAPPDFRAVPPLRSGTQARINRYENEPR
ncbi:metal-dependent hydrolase [bacterium]|nr:metal-dependent hydrolase [bacterium]